VKSVTGFAIESGRHLVVDERGRDERCEDGRAADVAQQRQPLAEFPAEEPAGGDHGDHHADARRQLTPNQKIPDDDQQGDEDGNGDDPDPGLHQPPPALGPELLSRRGCGLGGLGF